MILGDGVSGSTRFDPQAKALGELLRSRVVEMPEDPAMTAAERRLAGPAR